MMRRGRLIGIGILFLDLVFCFSAFAQWEPIAPGFDFQKFQAPNGSQVYVSRMSLDKATRKTLDTCIAQGQLYKRGLPYRGRETVSSMVGRMDDSIFFWGERMQIIAAVNGDYWERKTYPSGPYTGRPQNGQVVSGWLARRFPEFTGGSGFFYTIAGIPHIGGDVRNGFTDDCRQLVFFSDGSAASLSNINVERGPNDLILYTPQWGPSTQTDNTGVEVLVQVDGPTVPIAWGAQLNSSKGVIVEVQQSRGNMAIPFDHVVLSGAGSPAAALYSRCSSGKTILLRNYIRDYGFPANLRTPPHPPQDWTGAFAAIGCDREILINGQITNPPKGGDAVKRARTGVAYNQTYVFFVVVDEISRKGSSGMTFGELAAFFRDALSATHGCSLDGGGSSCLWVRGKGIVNKPTDGAERATTNGLFMVAVQDRRQSSKFAPDAAVTTKSQAELRVGPGANYAALGALPPGQAGTIEIHNLSGVLATGKFWWKARFADATGWCTEDSLQ